MKAAKKRITLAFDMNYTDAIMVYADKEKIRQVVTNLLDNSIKYGKEKGETLKLQHSLEILNNKGEIELKNMKEWFEIFMDKSDYFYFWLPKIYEDYKENGEIKKVSKKDNYRNLQMKWNVQPKRNPFNMSILI